MTDRSRRVTSVEPLIAQSHEELLVNLQKETEASRVGGKATSCGEKVQNWRGKKLNNSRVRPGQQPVCPLPRLTLSGGFLAVLQSMEQARRADLQMAEERAELQEACHQAQATAFTKRQGERRQAQPATRPHN